MNQPQIRPQFYYTDNVPTHVLLPIADYELLLGAHDDPFIRDALAMMATVRTRRSQSQRDWPIIQIAQARASRGLSQRQLGATLGLPQSQISRIEHTAARSTATLEKIAKVLGIKLVIG